MLRPLKFLFVPCDAVGHINACTGIAQELLKKGHSVAFIISNNFRGKLTPFGIVEKYFQDESLQPNAVDQWGEMVRTMRPALEMPPFEKIEHFHLGIYQKCLNNAKENDAKFRQIVSEVEPDLILTDFFHNPALSDVGVPWMIFLSAHPLGISTENVPPALAGLKIFGGDKALWNKFAENARQVYASTFEDLKNWVLEKGGVELKYDGRSLWTPSSPYGNLYMYPQELNYTMHRPDPPNWHPFDAFVRAEEEAFEIPTNLKNLPGKLVYVSLGTIGCSDLDLMRKLISICAKSPHRFIFSKGPLGDELELSDNMWGVKSLPQTRILPLVDLVITHGGNNTITESFYFGTRVLVLPLFLDQLDNGARVEETGHGLQFDPYRVTGQELLDGIEKLLRDDLLEKRMKAISTRIKSSNSQFRAAELIENVAKNNSPIRPLKLK